MACRQKAPSFQSCAARALRARRLKRPSENLISPGGEGGRARDASDNRNRNSHPFSSYTQSFHMLAGCWLVHEDMSTAYTGVCPSVCKELMACRQKAPSFQSCAARALRARRLKRPSENLISHSHLLHGTAREERLGRRKSARWRPRILRGTSVHAQKGSAPQQRQ